MIRITRKARALTVEQVARARGVTRQRILHLCNKGRIIGAEKIGGRWLIQSGYTILPNPTKRGPRVFTTIAAEAA